MALAISEHGTVRRGAFTEFADLVARFHEVRRRDSNLQNKHIGQLVDSILTAVGAREGNISKAKAREAAKIVTRRSILEDIETEEALRILKKEYKSVEMEGAYSSDDFQLWGNLAAIVKRLDDHYTKYGLYESTKGKEGSGSGIAESGSELIRFVKEKLGEFETYDILDERGQPLGEYERLQELFTTLRSIFTRYGFAAGYQREVESRFFGIMSEFSARVLLESYGFDQTRAATTKEELEGIDIVASYAGKKYYVQVKRSHSKINVFSRDPGVLPEATDYRGDSGMTFKDEGDEKELIALKNAAERDGAEWLWIEIPDSGAEVVAARKAGTTPGEITASRTGARHGYTAA